MRLIVTISEVGSSYSLQSGLQATAAEELKKILNVDELDIIYSLKEAGSYSPNHAQQRTRPSSMTEVNVLLKVKTLPTRTDIIKKKIVASLVKLIVGSNTTDDLYLTKEGKPMITTTIAVNNGKPTVFLDLVPKQTP